MTNSENRQYFTIPYATSINVVPLPEQASLPDQENFEQEIPTPFRVASETAAMDHSALRAIRNLGDVAEELAEYLNHQARKINVIMGYILQMQDDERFRAETTQFGAGEFSYRADEALAIDRHAQVKLFLPEEAAAVFSYARVIHCEPHSQRGYIITMQYARIREEDRELLIRATLHQQTKQLKQRSQQRNSQL